LAKEAKKIDNKFFRERFALEASNIAGRFGVTVGSLVFENQFLKSFSIKEGDACDYSVDQSSIGGNSYSSHNVDTSRQALALHGIGSAYINKLLDLE
jgi:hypothetical protein